MNMLVGVPANVVQGYDFEVGDLSVTFEKLEQKAEQDHEEEMARLKRQLDIEIRIDITQLPCVGVVPAPFWLTFADIEGQRVCEIERAHWAICQDWNRMVETSQRLRPLGIDLCSERFMDQHQAFKAQIEDLKARGLRRIVEKRALLEAFYDARLDIYNALRIGDVREAKEVVVAFLARPAVAP